MLKRIHLALIVAALAVSVFTTLAADKKKIVLVAGRPSHGPGDHEFNAGVQLLKKCLDKVPGVEATFYLNGWPADAHAFDGADAIMLFMDGGGGHPAIAGDHLKVLGDLMKKGVGLGCYHYAVEVPKDKGGPEFLEWIGGYYEDRWSTNPHWEADIKSLPKHPVTRGVKPFKITDEWYYNIRFRPEMKGVTAILVANPSDETRQGKSSSPRGPYPHIVAASGRDEILAWAAERPDGGRGFGFTGAHFHKNWGNPDFRKLVLNSLLWLAKMEVPADGVESSVTDEELKQNLDPKGGNRPRAAAAPATTPAVAAAAPLAQAAAPSTTPAPGRQRGQPAPHDSGPEAARDDLKKMSVADGLAVTLFASEPMMVNPCDMDIDARGRVWITEGANYRISLHANWGVIRPEGDRIVVMEDTNGDGVADKQSVFYQDPSINAALGICVLGNKVIVSSAPNVFVLTDTDGDGVADKRELLFTGISGFDHDHAVHAFVFGPDGKLYFNSGNAGRQIKRPTGKLKDIPLHGIISNDDIAKNSELVVDVYGNEVADKGKPYRDGMVFRCNMDGSEFETLAWNFRNNYEVAVDSFGTLWQSDNDDDGNRGVRINYVMEFGNYGFKDEVTGAAWGDGWKKAQQKGAQEDERPIYHWHQHDPGVIPNLLHTGNGSPTGILVYEGKLLPKTFQGQMIHADAGTRVVRSYPVEKDGAGYKASITNILTSSDSWYRPSDVCVGPDGSLFIADWNDAGVGGHNMADRKLETMSGRVYRVAPTGSKYIAPHNDFTTAAGCVAALQSPNHETRYLAWTGLHAMQGKAEKELLKLWKSDDSRMRARAFFLLGQIKGSEKKYVETALKDKDSDIRIAALRLARELKMDLIPYVAKLVKDPSAQVRRECAIALRHNPSAEAPRLWATLAQQHDGKDRWYLEALGIAADKQEDKFFAAWLSATGAQWNTPAGRDIIWRSRSSKSPALLVKIITDKSTPATDKPHYMRALDFVKGPEKEAALVELLGAN